MKNISLINQLGTSSNEVEKAVSSYQKVADIIERTHVAMGRKVMTETKNLASSKAKLYVRSGSSNTKGIVHNNSSTGNFTKV